MTLKKLGYSKREKTGRDVVYIKQYRKGYKQIAYDNDNKTLTAEFVVGDELKPATIDFKEMKAIVYEMVMMGWLDE